MSGGRPVVTLHDETFKHFQTATARPYFVLGEFRGRCASATRLIRATSSRRRAC